MIVLSLIPGCGGCQNAPPTMRLGVCDVLDVHDLDAASLASAEDSLDEAAELGLTLVRPHRPAGHVFAWTAIEGSRRTGPADLRLADQVVSAAGERGLELMVTLQPFSEPQRMERAHQLPQWVEPGEMPGWVAFVSHLVERYDGDGRDDMPGLVVPIKLWEAGNEPSCATGDSTCAQLYLGFLRGTSEAVHRADPDADLLIGGAPPLLAQDGAGGLRPEVPWLYRYLLSSDPSSFVDGMSFHVLTGAANPPLEAYLSVWREVSGTLPLWITETGTRAPGDGRLVAEDPSREAEWAERHLQAAQEGGVAGVLWCRAGGAIGRAPGVAATLTAQTRK